MTKSYQKILFALTAAFLFFFLAGKIPLWSSDEGRYGEIAREMWETKNFIIPHFNYVFFLDKPVLAPVFSAFSIGLFGVNSFAVRLPLALAALTGIFAAWGFARKLFDEQTANLSAVLLLSTVGYVLVGRFAVIDMLMTLWISLALFCFMSGYFQKKSKCYLAAYVFMGLGFLTKGLIALVLPGMTLFIFLLWNRDLKALKSMRIGWGILIIALVIAPWWIAITKKIPDFFHTFIIEQHFQRFTTGSFGRRRPVWFYLPIFLGLSFPWSLFLPFSFMHNQNRGDEIKAKLRFLICWAAVILVFFSIPKSKLPYYILPACVPAAIFTASFFSDWIQGKDPLKIGENPFFAWVWKILPFISAGTFIGINIYLVFGKKMMTEIRALEPVLEIGLAIMTVFSFLAFFCFKKGKRATAVLMLSGMIYSGLILTFIGMKEISPYQSTYSFAEYLKTRVNTNTLIGVLGSPDSFSDFPFYLKRRIKLVGPDRGTLTEQSLKRGNEAMAREWFPSMEEFTAQFEDRSRPAYCLVRQKYIPEFERAGMKNYKVPLKIGKVLLISNQENG